MAAALAGREKDKEKEKEKKEEEEESTATEPTEDGVGGRDAVTQRRRRR